MTHFNLDFLTTVGFKNCNGLSYSVLTCWHELNNTTTYLRGCHNSVFCEEIVFEGVTKHVTTSNEASKFKFFIWSKVPKFILIKGWYVDSTRHEDTTSNLSNSFKRSLNTVKNSLKDT